MKKALFVTLLLLASTTLFAQIKVANSVWRDKDYQNKPNAVQLTFGDKYVAMQMLYYGEPQYGYGKEWLCTFEIDGGLVIIRDASGQSKLTLTLTIKDGKLYWSALQVIFEMVK